MKIDFFNKYKYKIKNLNSLIRILKNYRSKKKVVMCHGVFDVVHPGHIRHLAFAKSKADILVVSITADKHIKKGKYRPHVPQLLRALNLAAFEMVDFVLIDNNKTPLNNISKIKPDFFAKGFEYSKSNMPVETKEEIYVIEKFGG
ncbi:adenylyltransferase/cytidyltransferase family protein, partial [Pelagibacteraceae bacterium]|nr:adenylyltransferase/cytidyltransferase family protein [Pelagibacteraceae bacterium]